MSPEQYHTLIKQLQEQEFPGTINDYEHVSPYGGPYVFFAPSHHFRPSIPLITEEIVVDLRDNKKRLLSVGCGPAHLERLLVTKLGVDAEQITLADISDKYVPDGFVFYQFDMHQDWPHLGTFDYVLFPESPLINNHFSAKTDFSFGTFRQPARENGLYTLLVRSLKCLNTPGQSRLTCAVPDFVKDVVKPHIEAEFPNVTMQYSDGLTYIIKK
ncbi:MAG: hypothetical protein Q7K45_01720 [Nanoarchaeota archaeon]|nr:hypothetical protein [Nanoarchaeota archaeon]